MPVNSRHALYNQFASQWMRCRDAHAGSDAVKGRGTAYLPALEGMNVGTIGGIGLGVDPVDPGTGQLLAGAIRLTPYEAYLQRALFYPATSRTVLGLVGLLFSKPPTPPKVNDKIQQQFKDITLTGQSLHGFSVQMAREILMTGRVGALIDYADAPRTSDEDRPYWLLYPTEDIVNWRATRIGGRYLLTLVVLRETVDATDDDEFAPTVVSRYRVLRLQPGAGGALTYTVQLYTESTERKGEWIAGRLMVPVRRGMPLDFIPFQFCGPTTLDADPEHPPLVDLVDVNLSHYRTSADREHGAHFTALPTPWVKGHTLGPNESLGVGAGTAWVFPNPDAQAGMLEFSGAGLAALKDIMEEKRLLMATLGARMLETQRNVQEAAQTVAMRHAGEGSALGIMADTLGNALSNLARWHIWWNGQEIPINTDEQLVTINPELLEQLTTEDISKLVAAWQAGAISYKTLYYNLQWGEWTRPEIDADTEREDIDDEDTGDEPAAVIPGPIRGADMGDEEGSEQE